MSKKQLSAKEIVEVYMLYKFGAKTDEVKEKTGVAFPGEVNRNIRRYLNGEAPGRKRKAYVTAARMIKKDAAQGRKKEEEEEKETYVSINHIDPEKRHDILAKAFEQLEEQLYIYIVKEVEAQTAVIRRENEVMKSALEKAKIPNIVSNLRKRFRGEDARNE